MWVYSASFWERGGWWYILMVLARTELNSFYKLLCVCDLDFENSIDNAGMFQQLLSSSYTESRPPQPAELQSDSGWRCPAGGKYPVLGDCSNLIATWKSNMWKLGCKFLTIPMKLGNCIPCPWGPLQLPCYRILCNIQ